MNTGCIFADAVLGVLSISAIPLSMRLSSLKRRGSSLTHAWDNVLAYADDQELFVTIRMCHQGRIVMGVANRTTSRLADAALEEP
jgi:hypothetical protein